MIKDIFKEEDNGVEFSVYLTPGAKKEDILGMITSIENETFIKISVHAKPTDNQANTTLIEFISKKFKIAKSNIAIKRGLKSRSKRIFISGVKLRDIPEEILNIFNE